MYKLSRIESHPLQTMTDDSLVSVAASTREIRARQRHLSDVLQTTLEVTQVLKLFAEFIDDLNTCLQLTFQYEQGTIGLLDRSSSHTTSNHQHTALLYADDMYLGQLNYRLHRPMSAALRRTLEQWHQQLAFPLRNALMYQQARNQAIHDYLTGLGNRSYLEEQMQHAIFQQRRAPLPLGLVLLDVDGFKAVNDGFGHSQGDEVLKALSQLLKEALRDSDQVFRYGGDEFVLMLHDTNMLGVQHVFARIQSALKKQQDQLFGLSISGGAVTLSAEDTVPSVLARADEAMYRAKRAGKNQLCCLCK